MRCRKSFWLTPLIVLVLLYNIAAVSSKVEVEHVYGILPVFIVSENFTFRNKPGETGAINCGILIAMRPETFNVDEIRRHELIHSEQFYRSFFTDAILYYCSQKYRAKTEAEAYAVANIKKRIYIPNYAEQIQMDYAPDVDLEYIKLQLYLYYERAHGSEDKTNYAKAVNS